MRADSSEHFILTGSAAYCWVMYVHTQNFCCVDVQLVVAEDLGVPGREDTEESGILDRVTPRNIVVSNNNNNPRWCACALRPHPEGLPAPAEGGFRGGGASLVLPAQIPRDPIWTWPIQWPIQWPI